MSNTKDSIVIVSSFSDITRLNWLKSTLHKKFDMADCGTASVCLGLEISHNREKKTVHISQRKYIIKILERLNMLDCKPDVTPMESQP